MRWSLPNILTVLRLLAAPGLALVFVVLPRPMADWVALVLFVGAAATDWLDGYLARAWDQASRFGAMLDPIADKAMVIIAVSVALALSGLNPWLAVPAAVILFREVFVSGLREYLGADAGRLAVTRLAKWKTTAQMAALTLVLLGLGLQEAHYWAFNALSPADHAAAMAGREGIWRLAWAAWTAWGAGLVLFWIAAALTAVTGWDYFRKALPYLAEDPAR